MTAGLRSGVIESGAAFIASGEAVGDAMVTSIPMLALMAALIASLDQTDLLAEPGSSFQEPGSPVPIDSAQPLCPSSGCLAMIQCSAAEPVRFGEIGPAETFSC